MIIDKKMIELLKYSRDIKLLSGIFNELIADFERTGIKHEYFTVIMQLHDAILLACKPMSFINRVNNRGKFEPIEMKGVSEYADSMPVYLVREGSRYVIKSFGGFNITLVDLEQLLGWVGKNMPYEYIKYSYKENKWKL